MIDLTKEDIVSFCDRHPDVARTPDNFMIAINWIAERDLEPTASNLDLAYEVCQQHFEPAPPSEEERSKMSATQFLKAVVIPEFKKRHPAPKPEGAPFILGRRGTADNRIVSEEQLDSMTAKEYRESVLGIKRGNGE